MYVLKMTIRRTFWFISWTSRIILEPLATRIRAVNCSHPCYVCYSRFANGRGWFSKYFNPCRCVWIQYSEAGAFRWRNSSIGKNFECIVKIWKATKEKSTNFLLGFITTRVTFVSRSSNLFSRTIEPGTVKSFFHSQPSAAWGVIVTSARFRGSEIPRGINLQRPNIRIALFAPIHRWSVSLWGVLSFSAKFTHTPHRLRNRRISV